MTLRMNSVSTKFWTIIRRPIGNCPWKCSKYLSSPSREGSWNWQKRPGTFVLKKKQCFLVEEVLPQVTEMARPMNEPVSWTTEEDLGQSVEVHREGAARVPTDKFEAGQLMQWPDIKSDGVMIDGIMLESEMSLVGSVRDVAEPVSVAAKSEVFTPVVFAVKF